MANKKGEGVRGVLGNFVSREKEKPEQSDQPPEIAALSKADDPVPADRLAEIAAEPREFHQPASPQKKATGIKGRPRGRTPAPLGERSKVTLSIDEVLRDQFYRLAHAEMMQPGEYVERALRYYIEHHRE